MSSTFKEATEHLKGLLGVDRADWEWGKLHQVHLVHPLSSLVDRPTRERLDVGPVPRGGSGDTVGNTAYHLENLRQTGGSSWRVVVDVGGWNHSLFINSPGQSGDPASPHYSDRGPEMRPYRCCTVDQRSRPLRKDGSCSSQQDGERPSQSAEAETGRKMLA